MKIILLKDIHGIGRFGDIAYVAAGYARNYLIPYGKALLASQKNMEKFEIQKKDFLLKEQIKIQNSYKRIKEIKSFSPIKIHAKSSETGKLFGSISLKDILSVILSLGIKVNKNEIIMQDSVIRYIGKYNIIFQPHKEVSCYITIYVISEKS
ncbi:50S ribosomal protein L9 [Buchnera aphidicola]|uniref:50S ribosomal protein L9 n=1 Tax=Buchnera aphidicola TaxID=9 RepID=UPI0031B8A6C3